MDQGSNVLNEEEQKTSAFWKVAQLFVVPASIVIVCLGFYALFKFMSGNETTPEQLLDLIKTSGGHSRKIYLHEFANNMLQLSQSRESNPEIIKNLALKTGQLIEEFIKSKEDKKDDIYILILSLGLMREQGSRDLLVHILSDFPDPDIQMITLDSLGAIKDASLEATFRKYVIHENPDVRRHAVFNLASLELENNTDELIRVMSDDDSAIVRINAALGLAYFHKNEAALEYLCNVLDSRRLSEILGIKDSSQWAFVENAILNIMEAIYVSKKGSCLDSLQKLVDDPSIPSNIRNQAVRLINLKKKEYGGTKGN